MQQQTKDPNSKERLSLPPSASGDTFREGDDKIPEFIPPSTSSTQPPSPSGTLDGEGQQDESNMESSNPMEVQMEDDDRRSHMELMAENNPLDDDDDEDEGRKAAILMDLNSFIFFYHLYKRVCRSVELKSQTWAILSKVIV